MTKVLHIITRLDHGGSATNTIASVDLLRKHGFDTALAYGATHDPDHSIAASLEAMATGCPVICSMSTSLAEVAGDAALAISDLSNEGISRALMSALGSDSQERTRFFESGKERASHFAPGSAAENLRASLKKHCMTPMNTFFCPARPHLDLPNAD